MPGPVQDTADVDINKTYGVFIVMVKTVHETNKKYMLADGEC